MLEKYKCDEDELDSEYLRLQGLGICESAHEFGEFGNPNYRHFNYHPTPMLDKLIQYILLK